MECAILTLSDTDMPFARLRKARHDFFSLPFDNAQLSIYTLPCCENTFSVMHEKQKQHLLQRALRQIKLDGVECLYTDRRLQMPPDGNFFMPTGRRIFSAFAGQIIERYLNTASHSSNKVKIYIYENPFTNVGAALAAKLAMHTRQLSFISQDTIGAQKAADALFEEYGLAVLCSANEKLLNKADIALLLTPPNRKLLTDGLILDFSAHYPYRAYRDFCFNTAVGYARLLSVFDSPDCQCAEFILYCYGLENEPNPISALYKIGWNEKA